MLTSKYKIKSTTATGGRIGLTIYIIIHTDLMTRVLDESVSHRHEFSL